MSSDKKCCGVVYAGPTYPHRHGIACEREAGHENHPALWAKKHTAIAPDDGHFIAWFTPDQKAELFDKPPEKKE